MRAALAFLAALTFAAPASAARTILVRFANPAAARARVEAVGDDLVRQTSGRVAVVRLEPGETAAQALTAYRQRPDVLYAEPNGFRRPFALNPPNDPHYNLQWALPTISALAGWTLFPASFTPAAGATIGIVDTGVEATHQDLAPNMTGSGATCVGGCAAGDPPDLSGHGTHVAGIAAAAADNGLGIAGLSFASPIVAVGVFHNDSANGLVADDADVADGITWAAQHGARVINLSLGGPGYSATLCSAVSTAVNTYHAVVVAAAGNSSSSVANYPASCPGAIGVAATDSNDAPASFSDYGYPNVFVSAPGVNIASTYTGNSYAYLDGTSMASPYVTGLAALVVGEHPTASVAEIRQILARSSDKVGGVAYGPDPFGTCVGCTWDAHYGYGRIDVQQALAASVSPPPPPPPPPPSPSATPPGASPPSTRDTQPPAVRVFPARGRPGRLLRLRYTVTDDSGKTTERLTVVRRSRTLKAFTRRLRTTGNEVAFWFGWRAPAKAGNYRFCVRATDRAGNRSPLACAPITVR
ncbi:MAG: S8 family serine peptidase [Gaiellaceae bacterium]